MKTNFFLALVLCLTSFLALAQGFDENYEVRYGDINGDGRTDLYIHQKPKILILHGDIATPIALPDSVKNFILSNNGVGSFSKVIPSESQAEAAKNWPIADVDAYFKDIDFNGYADLVLGELSGLIEGAHDQIVFSASTNNDPPAQLTSLTQQVQNFIMQTNAWSLDPNYFDDNAPWVTVGIEPASRIYFGTVFSSSNISGINWLLAQCAASGYFCATTSLDPPYSECVRYQPVYDEFGQYVGHAWIDVCDYNTHVFRYIPGSIVRQKSYAYFNQRAVRYAREIEDVMPNGVEEIDEEDPILVQILNSVLRGIIREEFGSGVFDNDEDMDERSDTLVASCTKKYGHANFEHNNFVKDDDYSELNPSFHHYDVETKMCDDSQGGCLTQNLRSVLELFSYPSKGMKPVDTPLDGATDQLVYFAPPSRVHDPSSYRAPYWLGHVSQHLLASGNWPNAIQNRTRTNHLMHPGTVSRTIRSKSGSKYIFTHGIGENDRGTLLDGLTGALDYQSSQAINMVLGCMNDLFGPQTFKTLDKQAIKYWNNQTQMQTFGIMAVQPNLTNMTGTYVEE